MISFVVFKSPAEGGTHVFRLGGTEPHPRFYTDSSSGRGPAGPVAAKSLRRSGYVSPAWLVLFVRRRNEDYSNFHFLIAYYAEQEQRLCVTRSLKDYRE
jgi:hypothetical protein